MMDVSVSVVMPVFNGIGVIDRQLEALEKQSDPPEEILVVDNRSTDGLRDHLQPWRARLPQLKIVDAFDRAGINHARNVGVKASSGRFLLLCDCDDEVQPDWVAAFRKVFLAGAELVGGALDVVSPMGPRINFDSAQTSLFGGFSFLLTPAGANCGFSRRVFDSLGGFDEEFKGGGDETEFFWRAQLSGERLVFVQNALIRYWQRDSVDALVAQSVNYGRSHVKLFAKFRSNGMPRRYGYRTVAQLILAAMNVVRERRSTSSGLRLRTLWATACGRVRQSVRDGVFYV